MLTVFEFLAFLQTMCQQITFIICSKPVKPDCHVFSIDFVPFLRRSDEENTILCHVFLFRHEVPTLMMFSDEQICFCFDFIPEPQGYHSLETHHFQTESFFNPPSVDFTSGLIFYLIYLKKLNWAVCSENSCLFFSWSVKTAKGDTVFEELHKHLGAKENSFCQQKPQTRLTASALLSFFCVSFISSQERQKLRKPRRLRRRKMADFQAATLTFICCALLCGKEQIFLIPLRIWFHLSPSEGAALLNCSMSHDDFHDELEKKLEAQKIHRPVKSFSDVLNVSIDITVVGLLGVVSLWETNKPANVAPRVGWVILNLCFNARTKSTSPWPCTFGKSWYVLKACSVWDTRCSHVSGLLLHFMQEWKIYGLGWNAKECGFSRMSLPRETFWVPDIHIKEL